MGNHHDVYLFFMLKWDVGVKSMKKGQKRRTWTPEQKAEIVHKHLDEHVSVRTLEKELLPLSKWHLKIEAGHPV